MDVSQSPKRGDSMGWKRGKRGREEVESSMVELTGKLLEAMTQQDLKRRQYEAEHTAFQKLAHQENLQNSKACTMEVTDALKDLSNSLRFFAVELAKKL